jgi:hypothetical protein
LFTVKMPIAKGIARRALGILAKTAMWVGIVALTLLVIFMAINWRDEDLTSEARALAEFQPSPIPDSQNAYLALLGFDAPSGVDAIAAGAKVVAKSNAASLMDRLRDEEPEPQQKQVVSQMDGGKLKFARVGGPIYGPPDCDALPQAISRARDIIATKKANAELVDRYLAMHRMPGFVDTSTHGVMGPHMALGWGNIRQVLLAEAALNVQTHGESSALTFLASDIALWRRILAGENTTVDKIVAERMLAEDYRLLSDLIAFPALDIRRFETQIRPMLEPVSPAELSMARMFMRDFQASIEFMRASTMESSDAGSLEGMGRKLAMAYLFFVFKPNATTNLEAHYATLLGNSSPGQFARLQDDLNQLPSASIYNPVGRMFVNISAPFELDTVARVFDLAAYVQLTRAQFAVRLASPSPEQVPAIMAAAGPDARNPYTGEPFKWDAAHRSLSFEPMHSSWRKSGTQVTVPANN